jgi:N-acetylglucosamine-6-phosphate deacetylase
VTLISAAALVCGGRVSRPGWLHTSGDRILDCGSGKPPRPADVEFPDATVMPGFVDMHVHGGGGASYTGGGDAAVRAVAFHRRHGTTSTLASLMTAAPDELLNAVSVLAESSRRGAVAGIHLEGPWLSPQHCGAHDRRQLRDPHPAEIDALLAAGDGAVRMVTLAPELPGGIEAIKRCVDAGVVVAVGHTDATYAQTRQAIDAGVSVGTHLFNAMRPVHQREPGPALALLQDPRVTVELIADGVHVHRALVRHVIEAAGPDRVALVTDATAAAGSADGRHRLGGKDIDVVSGVARVRGTSTIAGSTATMDQLFRAAVELGSDPDAALVAATQMTSATAARTLGLDRAGYIGAGQVANFVVLNRDLQMIRVMSRGAWVAAGCTDSS